MGTISMNKRPVRVMIDKLGALVVLVVLGCRAADQHPIKPGKYLSPSGDEGITVFESRMRFQIRLPVENREVSLDKTYSYTALDNGRIEPLGITSEEWVFGIGRFDWFWNGETITQKDTRSEAPTKIFRRK
jgi:hypothetical protein